MAIFLAHAAVFRHWIMDDAGITFAYARNLAGGHGLVSQPGAAPVEGYSNFLWLLMQVPFFWANVFDPLVTPKVLGVVLVAGAFVVAYRIIRVQLRESAAAAVVVLSLAAANTSFAAWTTSGLENSLYVLLVVSLLSVGIGAAVKRAVSAKQAVLAAVVCTAIAMTRPDGICYSCSIPIVLVAVWAACPPEHRNRVLRSGLAYLAALSLFLGAFLAFRLSCFHDFVPNTYHAKAGPGLRTIISSAFLPVQVQQKLADFFSGVGGRLGGLLFFGLLAVTVNQISVRRFRPEHWTLLVFVAIAAAAYVLLPQDWMEEFRFASPLLILIYIYTAVMARLFITGTSLNGARKTALAAVLTLLLTASSVETFSKRTAAFAAEPPTPFDVVARVCGFRFNNYADALGIQNGSLLTPDIGGALYYSKLRVYDMAGLTDRTIARELYERGNRAAWRNYVLEKLKPTFIETHGHFTFVGRLYEDSRFRRDYEPIAEFEDLMYRDEQGRRLTSGVYVRRDAVRADKQIVLERLRRNEPALPYPFGRLPYRRWDIIRRVL